jgi:hypothetical protein
MAHLSETRQDPADQRFFLFEMDMEGPKHNGKVAVVHVVKRSARFENVAISAKLISAIGKSAIRLNLPPVLVKPSDKGPFAEEFCCRTDCLYLRNWASKAERWAVSRAAAACRAKLGFSRVAVHGG